MRIIDLSRPITASMQVYPGDSSPEVTECAVFEQDGYRVKRLSLSSHTSTHMDAPAHMLEEGRTLDQLPNETFFGFGLIADVRSCAGREIEISDLGLTKKELAAADVLLLRTNKKKKFGTEAYLKDYPVLSAAAAQFLAGCELKGIGMDAVSIDHVETESYPCHKLILGAGMVIIENLRSLDLVPQKSAFCLSALPLAIEKADGAPVRVMAVLEK